MREHVNFGEEWMMARTGGGLARPRRAEISGGKV